MIGRLRHATATVALAGLLAACGAASQPMTPMPEPRDGRSGVQLSGSFEGRNIVVSDGLPRLLVRECNVRHDIPAEVCFATRNLDGALVVVGLANPEVVAAAGRLEVVRERCDSTEGCAAVDSGALVFVRVGDQIRQATGGTVTISELRTGTRYVGELRLRVGAGRLTGSFDVVPRPEPESREDG